MEGPHLGEGAVKEEKFLTLRNPFMGRVRGSFRTQREHRNKFMEDKTENWHRDQCRSWHFPAKKLFACPQ